MQSSLRLSTFHVGEMCLQLLELFLRINIFYDLTPEGGLQFKSRYIQHVFGLQNIVWAHRPLKFNLNRPSFFPKDEAYVVLFKEIFSTKLLQLNQTRCGNFRENHSFLNGCLKYKNCSFAGEVYTHTCRQTDRI
jgi:hypothetical protein